MEEKSRLKTLLFYENQKAALGYNHIAGIDEAGRGPLAGPVVAAACVLPKKSLFLNLNDSKQLSEKLREELFSQLTTDPHVDFGVGIVSHERIDEINIYQATIEAMLKAVSALKRPPDYLLVDGMPLKNISIPYEKIIKGDTLSQSIAAASVIAKVTRDKIMRDYHKEMPEYGFDKHKGYGTAFHMEAIAVHGPSRIHRRTFAPLNKEIGS